MKYISKQTLLYLLLAIVLLCNSSGCDRTEAEGKPIPPKQKADQSSVETKSDSAVQKMASKTEDANGNSASKNELSEPISLFDGESLDDWELIEFGGEGDIYAEDGVISFDMGDPMTGISSNREDLPKTNFEVSLEARKTDGVDFFCGLTFPVAESHCTLILGGWGGDICGLSCVDDEDASINETSSSVIFKKDQWYKIRVRVEPNNIQAWVDGKKIVNCDIEGRKVALRGDTTLCKPLGICSFQTPAEYKNIELRTIKAKASPAADMDESKKQ